MCCACVKLRAAASHVPQVVVCATGYNYDFPFLKRSDDDSDCSGCCDDDDGAVRMSWDRHVVEPL